MKGMGLYRGGLLGGLLAIAILSCAQPLHRTPATPPLEVTDLFGPAPLSLKAPISRFDEAIPLGNGLLGALLWGEKNNIKLSLDRGDLWDLRRPEMLNHPNWNYATIQKLVAAGDQGTLVRMFDEPYDTIPYPTKLPAGRVEFTFPESDQASQFELEPARALGRAQVGASTMEVFVNSDRPVILARVRGAHPSVNLLPPAALRALGCERAETGTRDGFKYYLQKASLGLAYCAIVGERPELDTTIFAVAITSTADGPDPLAEGVARVRTALAQGFESAQKEHEFWWDRFWRTSRVRVPDITIQRHYDIVKYYYGASSRAGAPPMPLQGVWTADDGGLPPWKGDYHNDLNTQMTYLAYHAAGLLDSGGSFIEFNYKLLPQYEKFAREFFQVNGAAVPGVMTLDGRPMGGWGQYSLSPTAGAWIAHSFYLHWKYTNSRKFLVERALPFCEKIGAAITNLLRPDAAGKLHLPLSSSPELFDNSLRAWLPPDSNFDLALVKFLFSALAEMSEANGDSLNADRWRTLLAQTGDFIVNSDDHELAIARGVRFEDSHRHFSHALAIHPLRLLTIARGDAAVVNATINGIVAKGTSWWCGYSFSWMACMAAAAGDSNRALDYLLKYANAFTSRNGFHLNGDQTKSGLSNFTYRPFTLEGNFLAMQAVHEMLLQSDGGVVRLFPATPDAWRDASFRDLRAEGGFAVSADRVDGAVARVCVRSAGSPTTTLQIRDPFEGRGIWNRAFVKKGDLIYFDSLTTDIIYGYLPGANK